MKAFNYILAGLLLVSCGDGDERPMISADETERGRKCEALDTLDYLKSFEELPGAHVGYSGGPSKHWGATEWFRSKLDYESALDLLDHESAIIRLLAAERVLKESNEESFQLIESASMDSLTTVENELGCTGYRASLLTFYLERIGYPESFFGDSVKWTSEQRERIDDMAMKSENSEHYAEIKEAIREYEEKQTHNPE